MRRRTRSFASPVRSRLNAHFWLGLFGALLLTTTASAQLTQVNVMPGFPNGPRTLPHPARPSAGTLVWGNANGGDPSALGYTYTWSFAPNPNVAITDDGNLSGIVTDPKFIVEEVDFALLGAVTMETVVATLTVFDGFTTLTDTVHIDIIDPTDPLSTPQTASLQIDVNIAIEDGLRQLYLLQTASGNWPGFEACPETGFALWCFGNKNHQPTTPIEDDNDIYAGTVQRGLDFIFMNSTAQGTVAANADVARGATANGVSDLNSNGRSIRICTTPGTIGYQHPIALSGVVASLSPTRVITVGPFAGETYKTFVEDAVDFAGVQQNSAPLLNQRGGWNYTGPSTRSDMSINSWYYVAMEGAEQTNYAVSVPDWIKQETEYCLVYHQTNVAGSVPFGYSTANPLIAGNGRATTAAGLSGLAFVETETSVVPGSIFAAEPAPLNTIPAKRTAGLGWLGDQWHIDALGGLGQGNRNNFYTMWTVARALRITADAIGLPSGNKVPLSNGGVTYDWEFGEEVPSPGLVPGFGLPAGPPGPAREGYFNWLVRHQDRTNANLALRGRWDQSTFIAGYGPSYETSLGTLVLIPEVFAFDACADVVVRRVDCDLDDPTSGNYTVTFDLTNNSGVDVTHLLLPPTSTVPGAPVTISPNSIPVLPALADGDTRTFTVTISNGSEGDNVCFRVGMADADFEECCSFEVCVELPNCDCLQILDESIICDPDNPGDYIYTVTMINLSSFTAFNSFFLGNPSLPAGVSFVPSIVTYPAVNPGDTVTVSTRISGASAGQLCFQITLHDEILDECCAVDHCIDLPDCGEPDPCLTDLQCMVDSGEVIITWTVPADFQECCAEARLSLPDGTSIVVDASTGFFVSPGCLPGEYCLTCIPADSTLPVTTICCEVRDEDCNPDPCIPELNCAVDPTGRLILSWNPPVQDPECCVELQISFNGVILASADPFSGMFVIPECEAGTYCISCISAFGTPSSMQCCTIDQGCIQVGDPVIISVPATVAQVGTEYTYVAEAYVPADEPVAVNLELSSGPPDAMFDGATGALSWTPSVMGDQQFSIRATTPAGDATVQAWVVAVGDGSGLSIVDLPFLRGDCSADNAVNVGDVIQVLGVLFEGGSMACRDACDANDSGGIDLSDGIFLLDHLFSGGSSPAEPFTNGCGEDPTDDDLDCESDACSP